MKNFLLKFGGMFASLALVVTTVVANSTCVCIMHAMKIKKRIFAFAVACAMTLPNIVQLTAAADEGEKYQYTMFGRNGITMNAGNLCMNGSMHTNKEAVITASNKNINGTVTTGSDIEKRVKHVYADQ
jgi:cyclic lactone autoinducer peptide